MKVLLTGGTGFTGDHLARKLFALGYDIKLLVRDSSKVNRSNDFDPEIVEGDIRNPEIVENASKGIDTVYHIAAAYRTAGIADQVYWDTHVGGTENLLRASLKNGVQRFVHCSTVGVHGHISNPPANENYSFDPGDIYQLTKLKGELKALEFSRETGLAVTVLRPCAIYGPGDMRLFKLFKMASYKMVPILGDGKIFYHMVYIDDLVDAFVLAAENEHANGESFIIGGEECYRLDRLLELIAEKLNKAPFKLHLPVLPFQFMGSLCERIFIPLGMNPPLYKRRIDFFTKSRAFDISKAKKFLNYKPKVSLEEGLTRTATWYQHQRLL